jgi:hypothetical protein
MTTHRKDARRRYSHARRGLFLIRLLTRLRKRTPTAPLKLAIFPPFAGLFKWRDPDSNRGHHDFQSCIASTAAYRHVRKKRINTVFCVF